jgi:hypothetical protein
VVHKVIDDVRRRIKILNDLKDFNAYFREILKKSENQRITWQNTISSRAIFRKSGAHIQKTLFFTASFSSLW